MSNSNSQLILASASPRRRDLLKLAGVVFVVVPACIDESLVSGESAVEGARRLSLKKARVVANEHRNDFVLAADTLVVRTSDGNVPDGHVPDGHVPDGHVLDGHIAGAQEEVMGKPADALDAGFMLRRLSGRDHSVVTGYSFVNRALGIEESVGISTVVRFCSLSEGDIAAYVASGEGQDKAGGYAIQGLGACFIASVNGSYTNVIGLPLVEVLADLKRHGLWCSSFLGQQMSV